MSDRHMAQLLKRIEEYHQDEKQRWQAWREEDSASLKQAWKERDEFKAMAQDILQSLLMSDEEAAYSFIRDFPWLDPARALGVEER